MRVYATTTDLTAWMDPDPAPANAASLLRSAAILLESATATAHYATDMDGYPTTTKIVDALRDASCSQAEYWADNGLDPASGSIKVAGEKVATSKAIGGAQLNYSVSLIESAQQSRAGALSTLSPEAYNILDREGLLDGAPVIV